MPTWSGHWRCTEQGRGGATASRPGTCRATGIPATTGAIFLRRAEGADDAGRMDGNNAMLCARHKGRDRGSSPTRWKVGGREEVLDGGSGPEVRWLGEKGVAYAACTEGAKLLGGVGER